MRVPEPADEMQNQSSLLNVSRLAKLNSAPTSVESPAEPVLLAMPPRLKLAPAKTDTSVPTVAGSICSGFRFDVVLTVARPVCKPENAPAVAATPAEEDEPNAGARALVALAEILNEEPAEVPGKTLPDAPVEAPDEALPDAADDVPIDIPAEMLMFNAVFGEVEELVTNAAGGLS
jgi:hypothetical protein